MVSIGYSAHSSSWRSNSRLTSPSSSWTLHFLHTFYGWWWRSSKKHHNNNHLLLSALFLDSIPGHYLIWASDLPLDIHLPCISCLFFLLNWHALLLSCYPGVLLVYHHVLHEPHLLEVTQQKPAQNIFTLGHHHLDISSFDVLTTHDNLVSLTCDGTSTSFYSVNVFPILLSMENMNTLTSMSIRNRSIDTFPSLIYLDETWLPSSLSISMTRLYFDSLSFSCPCFLWTSFFFSMTYSFLTLFFTSDKKMNFITRLGQQEGICDRKKSSLRESIARLLARHLFGHSTQMHSGAINQWKASPTTEGNHQRSLGVSTYSSSSSSSSHSLSLSHSLSFMISFTPTPAFLIHHSLSSVRYICDEMQGEYTNMYTS